MSDVVAAQQDALDRMYRAHVAPGDRYALLDFPDHPNVGDSAIWLGETTMLRRVTGRDPDYVSTWHDFDDAAFRAVCPDGVVFLHGGGNLGDVWPHHQRFREHVLAVLADRCVVQLPQSVHFDDESAGRRFAGLADRHRDLTLYVRDRRSLALARGWLGDRARLAPDSAFAMGHQPRSVATIATLALMRSDGERRDHGDDVPAGAVVVDWLEEAVAPPDGTGFPARQRQAGERLRRGLDLLSTGRTIVTDRLHGHILALLLGIPHAVRDNRYGKVGAYIEAWTSDSPLLLPTGHDIAA